MHPKEAKKEKLGTGRLCRAALIHSEIIMGVDFSENFRVRQLIDNPENLCCVLYPGENSLNISTQDTTPLQATNRHGKKLVLFLIDGTWPCAKKMMRQSKNIQRLPRLSFTSTHESIFQIKEQPAAYCLSTLESIHFYLQEAHRKGFENLPHAPQDNLIAVFKTMIDFNLQCALDPNRSNYRGLKKGYTLKENRVKRKKWTQRSIVFRG